MWYYVTKPSAQELLRVLNGVLTNSVDLYNGASVDGLTFILDVGGGNVTVTFAPAKSRKWTIEEIVAQINASVAGVASIYNKMATDPQTGPARYLTISHENGAVVRSGGTANTLLGFSAAADTEQELLASSDVKSITHEEHNGVKVWSAFYNN